VLRGWGAAKFPRSPLDKTVVRGGFGLFYENFNGLNYRSSVISNGMLSQQSSALITFDPTLAPNQQLPIFPNRIFDPSRFTAPNISLVDPSFRFPYVLHSSLQIEREILRDTTLTVGTMWTHGIFPFAQTVEAYKYLESNAQVGKVVITAP